MWEEFDEKELLGKVISEIDGKAGDEEMIFTMSNGDRYKFYHSQDCCETVLLEDICGDLSDIIGEPLLIAEEITNSEENPSDANPETIEWQESFTWTFYRFATKKGTVTIRWYGESNGYYSESVEFVKL